MKFIFEWLSKKKKNNTEVFMERKTQESGGKKSTRSMAPNDPLVKNNCNTYHLQNSPS